MQAISGFINAFKIKDLRNKLFYTLFILVIYRLGCHVPTPGVDTGRLQQFFASSSNNLFGLYDTFTGGAFANATIFALGIMPYISASIIIQLMGSVVPRIQDLQKQGGEGRAKITQYTRYLTVALAAVQALAITSWLSTQTLSDGNGLLLDAFSSGAGNLGFRALTTLTLTTGTVFIMWLGEQINQRGVGNGISLIIFIGIISSLPAAIYGEIEQWQEGNNPLAIEFLILALVIAIVAFIVFVEQGTRRIQIQSPRRVVGKRVMQAQNSYLPFKVNTAGVIPVIFASSVMFVPALFASWVPDLTWAQNVTAMFMPGHWVYSVVFRCRSYQ